MDLDPVVAELAATQDSLLTRDQAVTLGFTDRLIDRRVDDRLWIALYPGVYFVGAVVPSWRVRLHAACLAGGPHTLAAARAAGALYELDRCGEGVLEVVSPYSKTPIPPGVITHRTRRYDPTIATTWRGVPVTTVERTILDLAARVPPLSLEMALESAIRRNLTTTRKLEQTVMRPCRGVKGTRKLRGVLERRPAGGAAGSPLEVELVDMLRQRCLPPPVRQHRVKLRTSAEATVDLAWPDAAVYVEGEGFGFHAGRAAFDYDADRQNEMVALGWRPLRVTSTLIRDHPAQIVRQLRTLLGLDRAPLPLL